MTITDTRPTTPDNDPDRTPPPDASTDTWGELLVVDPTTLVIGANVRREVALDKLMNKLTIHGNITAKPELRFSRSGVPVATFTVATNRRRLNRQTGTWTDLPSVFHRVVCFNALAENVATSLTKGATVAVTGEFADDTFTREDGTTVRRTQIEAADVAASLRSATATLTKTRRTTSNPTGPEDRDDETTETNAERPELTVVGSD